MKEILNHLHSGKLLSREEAKNTLLNISKEQYNNEQVASFMTAYMMRDITYQELAGFRDAMLELCVKVDLEGRETIDIVGTGGDGKDTFNVSTCAAFLIAGAGYKVTKHGSYGVSSSSGSSDVLMALGYEFKNDKGLLLKQLDEVGITFFHAPLFHPAMKAVVPIRKALGLKTFFNMLGPLVSPAQPKYQLFGTFNLPVLSLYRDILRTDDKKFTAVYALDGYDEVSLTGAIKVIKPETEELLQPLDFGLPQYKQSDLFGGNTVKEAKVIFRNILEGKGTPAQNDVVAANAGLAIQTIKPKASLNDCISEAKESLESGKALKILRNLVS